MKEVPWRTAVAVLLLLASSRAATIMNGDRGLIHVRSALTTRKQQLWTTWRIRAWGQGAEIYYVSDGTRTRTTFWDAQAAAAINYGFSRHVSMTLSSVLYQDLNDDGGFELFGDTQLDAKFGSYQIAGSNVSLGLNGELRFPTGAHHNIIFEDYSAGTTELGMTGLFTYRFKLPDLPYEYRVHLNLGYRNYFDQGARLVKEEEYASISKANRYSQAFHYGFGLEFPTAVFDYGLEFFGQSWITFPPPAAAARENYLKMNLSLGYKPHPRIKLFTALDLRLTDDKETTQGPRAVKWGLNNYPGWRLYLGLRYMILPFSIYDLHKQVILESLSAAQKAPVTEIPRMKSSGTQETTRK